MPDHIAIIMDGNARWAKKRGLSVLEGHRAGMEALRNLLKLCADYSLHTLTVFAFSSENWQRPIEEIKNLMSLFTTYLKRELKTLHDDGVRLRFIGSRKRFSKSLVKQMEQAEKLTANNTRLTLVVAVDYGGQWDIVNAAKQLAEKVQEGRLQIDQITVEQFDQYTALSDLPKPDLFIRTSNMYRISNFMLWQLAYTELYFTDTLWPDFNELELRNALLAYGQRNRLYGRR